jgi:hypothetical protein
VESLTQSLNKDNLRDRLILAFTYNSEDLQDGILDFIARSKNGLFTSMIASSEWFHFTVTNEDLAKEIIKAVCEKLKYIH